MKKHFLLTLLLPAFVLISCGGNADDERNDSLNNDTTIVEVETPKTAYAEMCKESSKFALTIKGYKYDMSGDYAFETGNFDVKQSSIEWTNDSDAVITLKNYAAADLVGDRKDDQIDIVIHLYARHGKKIVPGTYKHSAPDLDYSSFTTMTTSKGKVYFNWALGMDEQGSVKIDFIEGDKACGSFMLASEKPSSDQIGTVRLNGSFRTAD